MFIHLNTKVRFFFLAHLCIHPVHFLFSNPLHHRKKNQRGFSSFPYPSLFCLVMLMSDNASWFFSQAIAAENCFGALGLLFTGYIKNFLQSRGIKTREALWPEILQWSDLYPLSEPTLKEWVLSPLASHVRDEQHSSLHPSLARCTITHTSKMATLSIQIEEVVGTGQSFCFSWLIKLISIKQKAEEGITRGEISCEERLGQLCGSIPATSSLQLRAHLALGRGGISGIWVMEISFQMVLRYECSQQKWEGLSDVPNYLSGMSLWQSKPRSLLKALVKKMFCMWQRYPQHVRHRGREPTARACAGRR